MISAARRSNTDGRSHKSNREWRVPSGSNPLRVVFYCRVSTDDQRDAGTVENQLSYLRLKYAVDFGPHAIKPMAFISGPIPFGFAVGADGFLQPSEQLVDPLGSTEAELVVDIFRRVADGQSSQKVATWLNRIGVPATKRYWKKELQRTVHAPSGALGWSAVRVRRMIHSPVYKGVRERLVA